MFTDSGREQTSTYGCELVDCPRPREAVDPRAGQLWQLAFPRSTSVLHTSISSDPAYTPVEGTEAAKDTHPAHHAREFCSLGRCLWKTWHSTLLSKSRTPPSPALCLHGTSAV